METKTPINLQAWSDSQIQSKLWLSEELERLQNRLPPAPTIWVMAGWYCVTGFLLLARGRLEIRQIVSFDADSQATSTAMAVNARWTGREGRFLAHTADIATLDYTVPSLYGSALPDIVINTACEHLGAGDWFRRIPPSTLLVLQSTDLPSPDHIACVGSEEELKRQLPLADPWFAGALSINRPGNPHRRFMTIGRL